MVGRSSCGGDSVPAYLCVEFAASVGTGPGPSGSPHGVAHPARGYLLDGRGVEFDVYRFTGYAAAGREALGRADPQEAFTAFDAALRLWRGRAYADMSDASWVGSDVARLEELRLSVVEGRCDAQLRLGDHHGAVAELDAHVRAHPLREHGCELLVLALYRAGRQAEALAILRDTRGRLTDELGIDPSVALRRLESDILAQSSTLDWHPPTSRALLLQRATAPVVVLEPADPGRSAPTTGRSGMGPPLPAVTPSRSPICVPGCLRGRDTP